MSQVKNRRENIFIDKPPVEIPTIDAIETALDSDGYVKTEDLPIATDEVAGMVKIGEGVTVTEDGTISVSGGGGGGSVEYSTQEREIGKWVDGVTPVYEKTFVTTNIAITPNTAYTLGNIPDLDTVVSIVGTLTSSDKNSIYASEYYSPAGKYSYFHIVKDTTNEVKFFSNDSWSSTNLICTVRYTKTVTPTP